MAATVRGVDVAGNRLLQRWLQPCVTIGTGQGVQDDERLENVKGAFTIKDASGVKNKNILLVDDVLTSGATCSEAAGALKNSGANIVYVLTLAN